MGGHRAFGAGDDLVDGPVDLAAVRADDALLDAIAGGALSGGADAFTGGDVFGRPGQDDDHLAAILAAWKADIEAEPMPELVDLDEASQAVEAGHAARDRRSSRTRRRMPFAVAAAAMAVALSGLGVAVHAAQPGDAMFGLTKVLFSQQADNAQKTQQVRETIVAANDAIARGDRATAQSLLQSAGSQIQAVQADDQPPLVQQRQDVLKSLAPTAPTSPSSGTASTAPGEPEGTTVKPEKPGSPEAATLTPSEDPSTSTDVVPPSVEDRSATKPPPPETTTTTVPN